MIEILTIRMEKGGDYYEEKEGEDQGEHGEE
jgi:hypothetical protein